MTESRTPIPLGPAEPDDDDNMDMPREPRGSDGPFAPRGRATPGGPDEPDAAPDEPFASRGRVTPGATDEPDAPPAGPFASRRRATPGGPDESDAPPAEPFAPRRRVAPGATDDSDAPSAGPFASRGRATPGGAEVPSRGRVPSREAVGPAEAEPLLPEDVGGGLRRRWLDVQLGFVDDPHTSVEGADALLAEVVAELTKVLTERREELADIWRVGAQDTEDLRLALRRYRPVIDAMLAR